MNPKARKGMNPAVLGLAGLVTGVVAGILMAPKSGKETRQDIAAMTNRIKSDVMAKLQALGQVTKETYQDAVHNVTQKYEQAKEITSEQAQELKDEFTKNYNEIKSAAEQEKKPTSPR